ncbi:MAG: hypothetical protein AABW88_02060 [Nanoarchaeota archaeon]
MLSFLIPSDVVQSLAEQKQIKNNKIETEKQTILFQDDVYQDLKEVYLQNQLTEISLCLKGKIINNTYFISSFYKPKTYFATPISVSSNKCEDSIITMHTHPFNNCLLSQQDVLSYYSYKDDKLITMVMCSVDKFALYGV